MKIAAIQTVSGTSLQANLERAGALLTQAARAGAELAVLPEYFCLMGRNEADKLALREAFGAGTVQDFLADHARSLGIWIVGGTLPLAAASAQHVRNTSLAFSPQGECVARYDKIHLFKFDNGREQYDESRVIEAGGAPQSFVLPSRDGHGWRVGLSVCYDLRFPELYRALAADLLLVPSAFTHVTGEAHWELLLRARAVENLAYVAAPAQGGRHENGRRTWGHSMVVDPWGQLLAQRADDGEGVVLAEITVQRLAQVRGQLPALAHRVL
ncbi:MAG: Nitrilase/cyanide hydratase and apolipoprotein N-acyltransferase [Ramlibacter sp.]|uniref:carbon-nitrogen hydrolase family protein n=1 Tax=Ramlibacter sp. TaxID=1917967 RepID=UPI002609EAE3|nr:carbon-nitrogen hydrolase family protein [Ramlibacter sp.]MDB5750568.1 Nitrilase/cyanide hydratase and apolipoprotein N-acyltransferase [Ramlibacter sp.]